MLARVVRITLAILLCSWLLWPWAAIIYPYPPIAEFPQEQLDSESYVVVLLGFFCVGSVPFAIVGGFVWGSIEIIISEYLDKKEPY